MLGTKPLFLNHRNILIMRNLLKKFPEVIKYLGPGFFVLNFMIIFISTIIFNVLHLDDKNFTYLIVFFAIPPLIGDLIYFYFRKKKMKA